MKKIVLSLIVLLGTLTAASAQNWSVEVGLAYPALDRLSDGDVSGRIYSNAEITFSRPHAVILPTLSVSAGHQIDNTPLCVRMNVFFNAAFNTLNGGPATLKERETIWHFMPELRVYYRKGETVNLYGSVSAGVRTRTFKETIYGDTVGKTDCRFSWQVSPFGMEIGGGMFYANMNIGYGWTSGLLAMGLGYRF
jgi:hypothetical protein